MDIVICLHTGKVYVFVFFIARFGRVYVLTAWGLCEKE